jgi:hypothetical protein
VNTDFEPRFLVALLLAAPLCTQDGGDWRMPFRSPQANLVPPERMWEHLRPMYEIARKVPAEQRSFENGVEIVDEPTWQKHYEALLEMQQDAGYVSLVLRESMHVVDRAIAMYGMFYVPEPAYVFNLIEHIPGEPSRSLREDGYRRAIEYLAVHLAMRNEGDLDEWRQLKVGPAGQPPPRPGDYSYGFDPAPFFALLDPKLESGGEREKSEATKDHVQVLWFLGRCIELRPALAAPYLDATKDRLRELLVSGEQMQRDAVKAFMQICDPEGRTVPTGNDADELLLWFDEVVHTVLPPIRHVSEGLVELHPSTDRDRLVEVGAAGLRDGTLGSPANGQTDQGAFYRGLRIAKTPPPLDELGLPVGATITAINGTPLATPADLLRLLETRLKVERALFVEFVDPSGTLRAKEFRIR